MHQIKHIICSVILIFLLSSCSTHISKFYINAQNQLIQTNILVESRSTFLDSNPRISVEQLNKLKQICERNNVLYDIRINGDTTSSNINLQINNFSDAKDLMNEIRLSFTEVWGGDKDIFWIDFKQKNGFNTINLNFKDNVFYDDATIIFETGNNISTFFPNSSTNYLYLNEVSDKKIIYDIKSVENEDTSPIRMITISYPYKENIIDKTFPLNTEINEGFGFKFFLKENFWTLLCTVLGGVVSAITIYKSFYEKK